MIRVKVSTLGSTTMRSRETPSSSVLVMTSMETFYSMDEASRKSSRWEVWMDVFDLRSVKSKQHYSADGMHRIGDDI